MKKKRKLSIEYIPDFNTIGIYTSQRNYRFCWLLNKNLNIDLKRLPDFLYPPCKQTEAVPFPVYFDENQQLLLQFFLIVNKTTNGILFDRPQNMDLIFLLRNSAGQAHPETLLSSIKKIPLVQAAYQLDDNLGNRAPGIFYDLEMQFGNLLSPNS